MFNVCLVMLSCLFLATLWLPTGKGLTCWLSCVFVTFPYCVLGQVWYLIVSIPDPCLPLYYPFKIENNKDPDQTVLMHRLGVPLLLASNKK